jgi:hypothetical protein
MQDEKRMAAKTKKQRVASENALIGKTSSMNESCLEAGS